MSASDGDRTLADVVDLHAHLFNLHSIPVRGILERWGVPSLLSAAVEKLLKILMEDDSSALSHAAGDSDLTELDFEQDVLAAIALDTPAEIFLDEDFLAGLAYVDSLDELLRSAGVARAFKVLVARGDVASTVTALRGLHLATQSVHVRTDVLLRFLRKVLKTLRDGVGKFRFLRLLTRAEGRIVRAYIAEYPEVGTFVHHMMDLEPHYGSYKPHYPYPAVQLQRMLRLAATTGGRMRIFVAFSPYRDDSLEIVKEAVKLGASGVKFYPPSGYRAAGNEDGVFKDAPPARMLDRRNHELFAWCASESIPLFTHCTPSGFEAGKDYGQASSPDYWRIALMEHPALRLCLGHAGGGSGWFQPNTASGDGAFTASFAGKVVALVGEFEHVYAELGYLDEILDGEHLKRLQRRLGELLSTFPKLGDRLCYGSDWHMLYQELQSARYLHAFDQLFAAAPLDLYRDRFFRENARRFLG